MLSQLAIIPQFFYLTCNGSAVLIVIKIVNDLVLTGEKYKTELSLRRLTLPLSLELLFTVLGL